MLLTVFIFFVFKYTATTEIYTDCHALSRHDALPILGVRRRVVGLGDGARRLPPRQVRRRRRVDLPGRRSGDHVLPPRGRSEEHTSELQSLMRISYAVFCLKQKTHEHNSTTHHSTNTDYPILHQNYNTPLTTAK